jgi:heme-degrading monooxygenase HmoA
MILEVADIVIYPGRQAEFELAIARGIEQIVSKAGGIRSWKVNKGIESPDRYLLMIEWETLEEHTIGFRQSPAFQEWRAVVGPFFAEPPVVEHFELLASHQ